MARNQPVSNSNFAIPAANQSRSTSGLRFLPTGVAVALLIALWIIGLLVWIGSKSSSETKSARPRASSAPAELCQPAPKGFRELNFEKHSCWFVELTDEYSGKLLLSGRYEIDLLSEGEICVRFEKDGHRACWMKGFKGSFGNRDGFVRLKGNGLAYLRVY